MSPILGGGARNNGGGGDASFPSMDPSSLGSPPFELEQRAERIEENLEKIDACIKSIQSVLVAWKASQRDELDINAILASTTAALELLGVSLSEVDYNNMINKNKHRLAAQDCVDSNAVVELKKVVEIMPDSPFNWIYAMMNNSENGQADGIKRIENARNQIAAAIQKIKEDDADNLSTPYKLVMFTGIHALYESLLGNFEVGMKIATDEMLRIIEDLINSKYYTGRDECMVIQTLAALMYAIQAHIMFHRNPKVYREPIQELIDLVNNLNDGSPSTKSTMLVCQAFFKEHLEEIRTNEIVEEILEIYKQAMTLLPSDTSNRARDDWLLEYIEARERLRSAL